METSKKKAIMITTIVVCLATAVVITVMTSSGGRGGIETIKRGEMMWIKCTNADCGAEYEMEKRDYYKYIEENPKGMAMPVLVCKDCGEESAYRAEKCPNCNVVFIYASVRRDLPDRCPECDYSKTEESRKQRRP